MRSDDDDAVKAAFELFVQKHLDTRLRPGARRYAAHRGLSGSCAEEIIFEALWRVWEKSWQKLYLTTDDERLRSVHVYMQFVAWEKYAAHSRRPIPVCAARIPDTTAEERMDERILARAALAKIGEVLAELSQIDQAIVELTAVAGMSSSVIGSELGLSQTAVTTRLSRARAGSGCWSARTRC